MQCVLIKSTPIASPTPPCIVPCNTIFPDICYLGFSMSCNHQLLASNQELVLLEKVLEPLTNNLKVSIPNLALIHIT